MSDSWSVLIEGFTNRELSQQFVEAIEKGIPNSIKTYIGNSKELYLRTTDEQPAPDNWWTKYGNIVILVSYLAEIGWNGKEIADVVEKPWHFDTEYQEALKTLENETS